MTQEMIIKILVAIGMVIIGIILRSYIGSLNKKHDGFRAFTWIKNMVILGVTLGLVYYIGEEIIYSIMVVGIGFVLLFVLNLKVGLINSLILSLLQILICPLLVVWGIIKEILSMFHLSNTGGSPYKPPAISNKLR